MLLGAIRIYPKVMGIKTYIADSHLIYMWVHGGKVYHINPRLGLLTHQWRMRYSSFRSPKDYLFDRDRNPKQYWFEHGKTEEQTD